MNSSEDPLDQPDFNVISYINSTFPNEQTLANIDEHIDKIKEKIKQHDEEISLVVRGQSLIERDGREALKKASNIIEELMQRIHDMKSQARKSEQTVNEITCDIKQLDNAKRNLTSAVIMLNNLHILVESIEKLKEVYDRHEYKQAASILGSIQDVLKQFDNYKHIPQINKLSEEIDKICFNLEERINIDFRRLFEVPSAKQCLTQSEIKLLAEACLVVSVLGQDVKEKLVTWFLNLQFAEYNALFKDSQIQTSSLNSVDKRYSWLKKHLLDFEEKYGFLFPPRWFMSERMAVEFCKITSESLKRIMSARPEEVNMQSLMFAIEKTTAFESLLSKRFKGDTLSEERLTNYSHPFERLVSDCFEPFLNVYIEAQEQSISLMFEKFIEEHQNFIKQQEKKAVVFNSAGKLFKVYENHLVNCVCKLSNRKTLLDLAELFRKYLREYSLRVLQLHLKNCSSSSQSSIPTRITSSVDINTGGMFSVATSGAAGLLQSLLKDDVGRSKLEPSHICCVLLTADFCLQTTKIFEKKFKEKIEPTLVDKVDFSQELEMFGELINGCIQLLLQDIEYGCEPGFTSMAKIQWSSVETPVGHSNYITEITNSLSQQIPMIRDYLQEGRNYFVQLCNKFITIFTPKYISNLFRCKPLSRGGAEQLLLDTHTLKKFLLNLPCFNSDIKSAPASYSKAVIKGMTKAEMILKVVLVPHNNIDSFIENYSKLLPDPNAVEFQRILEVKGVKRSEGSALLEAYNNYCKKTPAI